MEMVAFVAVLMHAPGEADAPSPRSQAKRIKRQQVSGDVWGSGGYARYAQRRWRTRTGVRCGSGWIGGVSNGVRVARSRQVLLPVGKTEHDGRQSSGQSTLIEKGLVPEAFLQSGVKQTLYVVAAVASCARTFEKVAWVVDLLAVKCSGCSTTHRASAASLSLVDVRAV